jgi:O-Antigen ligase
MLFLLLLPVIPAVWWVATRPLPDAVVDVYLPILFLVPSYYIFQIPHVIGITAWEAALLPILIITLMRHGRKWRFQRSDLWLALFLLGLAYAESRHGFSIGLREAVQGIFSAGSSYIMGKLVIEENGIRTRVVRRMLWLTAFVAILSVVEFRLSRNLFVIFYKAIFGEGSPNYEQIRGGFTRTQGPFGHAITAGLIFGSMWILALWLRSVDREHLGRSEARFLGVRLSTVLVWLLFAGLVMAGSRGPWLGAVAAYGVSRIGRAKPRNVKRTAIGISLLGAVLGGAAYVYFDAYTSVDIFNAKDKDQENAVYRRLLLENYQPIVKAGGLFGWGSHFPRVEGQPSIDNQYLWLSLTQGPWGLCLFLAMAAETSISLIMTAKRSKVAEDLFFSITLLAVLTGFLVTLTTVNLGDPAYELLFLFYGWGLSLRQTQSTTTQILAPSEREYTRIFA